jgi:hypothetical protein
MNKFVLIVAALVLVACSKQEPAPAPVVVEPAPVVVAPAPAPVVVAPTQAPAPVVITPVVVKPKPVVKHSCKTVTLTSKVYPQLHVQYNTCKSNKGKASQTLAAAVRNNADMKIGKDLAVKK